MLALHDENPITYQPAASLCTALQIVNHLQDIKYDCLKLGRVYLPADLMAEYGVSRADLIAGQTCPPLRKLIAHLSELIRGQLKEGAVLPGLIRSRRLRYQVCIILSLTNIMLKKINKGDVLRREIRLGRWDWLRGIVGGLCRGFFIRGRIY